MYGHISNAAVASITTTWKEVILGAYDADSASTRDPKSRVMPSAGFMDSIEFRLTYTGGPPTELYLAAFYDAARLLPIAGPIVLTAATASNGTGIEIDSGVIRGVVKFEKRYRLPDGASGNVHLFFKADAGTLAAPAEGLHLQWSSSAGGGR